MKRLLAITGVLALFCAGLTGCGYYAGGYEYNDCYPSDGYYHGSGGYYHRPTYHHHHNHRHHYPHHRYDRYRCD
jgi:hypothetical protein